MDFKMKEDKEMIYFDFLNQELNVGDSVIHATAESQSPMEIYNIIEREGRVYCICGGESKYFTGNTEYQLLEIYNLCKINTNEKISDTNEPTTIGKNNQKFFKIVVPDEFNNGNHERDYLFWINGSNGVSISLKYVGRSRVTNKAIFEILAYSRDCKLSDVFDGNATLWSVGGLSYSITGIAEYSPSFISE